MRARAQGQRIAQVKTKSPANWRGFRSSVDSRVSGSLALLALLAALAGLLIAALLLLAGLLPAALLTGCWPG